jgi:hypothetical protein
MENKNKVNAVIILMLAVTLIFAAVQNNKIKFLEDRLYSLENNLTNNFRMEVSNLRYYIDSALESSQSVVDTYSISYDGIDTKQETVNVIMNFKLKESSRNTKIQIVASNVDGSEVLGSFDTETSNGIDYVSKFPLSYLYDYYFDIYETGENGYTRMLNMSNSIGLYLKNDMDSRTHLSSSGYSFDKDNLFVNFEIYNNTFGEEGFQMGKIELVVSLDGKELYRKDVTNNSLINKEDIDLYNVRVAAGEIEPSADIRYNLDRAQMDSEGVEHGYYSIEPIPHEFLLGQKLEKLDKNTPEYKYSVEVTFKNGEAITLYGN